MSSIQPHTTGTIGSRNPYAQLLTPQSTGALASTSAETTSPSSTPALPAKNEPQMPRIERQATGALNSSTPSPNNDVDALNATLSASRPFAPPTTPPENRPTPARNSTLDILQEELPPAYTPGPNALQGERSVDFGPVRPFQNEPVRPPPRPIPDQFFQSGHGRSNSNGSRNHSSLPQLLGNLLVEYLSQPHRESGRLSRFNTGSSAPFTGRSISPQPFTSNQSSRAWSQYPGQRSVTPEPQLRPPSDGKPTARPIPGHPLLRDNRVLVYPLGFECRKCFNKGFRPLHASTFDSIPRALAPGDPSSPCRKCWHRYAQPYTPLLSQLDWMDNLDANFQRPISDPAVLSPPAIPNRGQTISGPHGTPGLRPQFTDAPSPGVRWQTSPGGSNVFEPGDPRIGGRLCVRCHGSGRIRAFILETETCNLCGGTGRLF